MPEIDNNGDDGRVPYDRSDDTHEGEFYAHFTAGTCPKHGYTAVRCLHEPQSDGNTTVKISCVLCGKSATDKESAK